MILVNLLPYRETVRQRRRKAFLRTAWVAVLLGCLLAGLVHQFLQAQMQRQQVRNQMLRVALEKMQVQIKSMEHLRAEIALLQERRRAVENLQTDRNLPTRMLMALAQRLPASAYLTVLRQDNQTITLQGVAQDNETVSAFLRNMDQPSSWYSKPELQEIVAVHHAELGLKQKVKEMNFSIRLQLQRASEAGGSPPSVAASGKSPMPS